MENKVYLFNAYTMTEMFKLVTHIAKSGGKVVNLLSNDKLSRRFLSE